MIYVLKIRSRANPELPGFYVKATLEAAVRLIETLEVISDFVFELTPESV
jgi:hypothetical protein